MRSRSTARGTRRRGVLFVVTALALGGCAVDLGSLGGREATANDINDCGVVVGSEEIELPVPEGTTASGAHGINEAREVAGYTEAGDFQPDRAVRWTIGGGLPTDLGDLGGGDATANAVNEAGTAAGWSSVPDTWPDGSPIRHAALFPADGSPPDAAGAGSALDPTGARCGSG